MVVSRIDRDIRPLFVPTASLAEAGGVVPQNPLARQGWSGNNLGDFWVGAKVNLTSQWRQQPVAFAVRGMVKLPTGDTDSGASTGKADFALDAIVSKEINERVEVSGYGGFIVRGSPDEVRDDQRVPLGPRRRLPVAQGAAVHGGADGRGVLEQHAGDQAGADGRGRVVPAGGLRLRRAVAGGPEPGADVAGGERRVCGRGLDVAHDDGHARRIS